MIKSRHRREISAAFAVDIILSMDEYKTKFIVVYGIACVKEVQGMKEIISRVPDVTADYEKIKRLVNICNECELDPEHLYDIVEDSLIELTS